MTGSKAIAAVVAVAVIVALVVLLGILNAGAGEGIRFGRSVAVLDDLDGDGWPEFAVGAPAYPASGWFGRNFGRSGCVVVYSGRSLMPVRRLDGPGRPQFFGYFIEPAGDLDRDGTRDLLVTYEGSSGVDVVSPRDGSLLRSYPADSNGEDWRAADGDLDANGATDLVTHGPAGLLVHMRGDLETTISLALPPEHGRGVFTATRISDLDGDGVADVMIGARDGAEGLWSFSSRTGRLLRSSIKGPVASLLNLSDVDGDSIDDIAVGNGDVFLDSYIAALSGKDGSTIWRSRNEGASSFTTTGVAMASMPDRDGDGVAELLIGGCDPDWHGVIHREGNVRIVSGQTGALLWQQTVDEVELLDPPFPTTLVVAAFAVVLALVWWLRRR